LTFSTTDFWATKEVCREAALGWIVRESRGMVDRIENIVFEFCIPFLSSEDRSKDVNEKVRMMSALKSQEISERVVPFVIR